MIARSSAEPPAVPLRPVGREGFPPARPIRAFPPAADRGHRCIERLMLVRPADALALRRRLDELFPAQSIQPAAVLTACHCARCSFLSEVFDRTVASAPGMRIEEALSGRFIPNVAAVFLAWRHAGFGGLRLLRPLLLLAFGPGREGFVPAKLVRPSAVFARGNRTGDALPPRFIEQPSRLHEQVGGVHRNRSIRCGHLLLEVKLPFRGPKEPVHGVGSAGPGKLCVDDRATIKEDGGPTFGAVHPQDAGLSTETDELDDIWETEVSQIPPEFHGSVLSPAARLYGSTDRRRNMSENSNRTGVERATRPARVFGSLRCNTQRASWVRPSRAVIEPKHRCSVRVNPSAWIEEEEGAGGFGKGVFFGSAEGVSRTKTLKSRSVANTVGSGAQGQGVYSMAKGRRWPPPVRFLWSAVRWEEAPRSPLPQVAIAGRSNVGKSSLINALVGRRGLARTSATPGRTQTLNFFLIEERFLLVDLPGYGWAKAPREAAQRWADSARDFVARSPGLKGVVALFDIRRHPSPEDLSFVARVRAAGRPLIPVATKCDKVGRGERAVRLKTIAADLGFAPEELVATSSKAGEGRTALWERILTLLEAEETSAAPPDTAAGPPLAKPRRPLSRNAGSEDEP